jgi:lysozyme
MHLFFFSNVFASGAKRPAIGSNTPTTSVETPTATNSSSAEFNSPWKESNTSIVLDNYEGNTFDWDKLATDKKVVGFIHRSSIGMTVDKKYIERKKIAIERGYLWGAYHLGKPGNTIAQAELFLSLVEDDLNTLMVLDMENATSGQFMTTDEAATFMQYIYDKTGQIPTIYANHSTTKEIISKLKNNPLIQQSKLWYARFKNQVIDFPQGLWPTYFLWQFGREVLCRENGTCPYTVPGTGYDMDYNVFYGSKADLQAQWNNN